MSGSKKITDMFPSVESAAQDFNRVTPAESREDTLRLAAAYLVRRYGPTNRAAGDLVRLAELETQGRGVLVSATPDRCATCLTELGSTDFAWLGERGADGEPPADAICLPCRDAMHHRWLTAKCPAGGPEDDHNWWVHAGGGWACSACRTVRTDLNDRTTQTRAPNVGSVTTPGPAL